VVQEVAGSSPVDHLRSHSLGEKSLNTDQKTGGSNPSETS
jgi:hypothetical protein